jgi:hypothetical protein
MKLKSYPVIQKPTEGDYKIEKRIAWWPKRVENRLIWLEKYKRVHQYRVRQRMVWAAGYGPIANIVAGAWDLITEQLINK